MHTISRFAGTILGLTLVVALIAGLIYLFGQRGQSAMSLPLDSPLTTPTPSKSGTVTPSPAPTDTPPATMTPVPTQGPAPDASGTLLYAVREGRQTGVYAISMDAVGTPLGAATSIIKGTGPLPGIVHPSPDGSRLAVEGEWGVTDIFDVDSGTTWPLFNSEITVYEMLLLSWHPDNRRLLIRAAASDPGSGLMLVDTSTRERLLLSRQQSESLIRDGAVSPDGRTIVYSFHRGLGAMGEDWTVGADGMSPTLVYTAPNADIFGFAWSPDGKQITFVGYGLTVMNPDGSNVRRLSKNYAGGLMFEPVWSPDSRTLAFIVWDGPGAFSDKTATPEGKDGRETWDFNSFMGTNIHLVDIETGEERRLLPDTGNIDPAWSPDGRQIAYASTRSGGAQIWVVNADGTNLRQVTQESRWVRYPVWRGATKP